MGAASISAYAERQDVGVLDEQQQIACLAGLTRPDEFALQREGVRVRDAAKAADLDVTPGSDPSARAHASRAT